MEATAFYDFAMRCLERDDTEASHRSAISRAYYAAYHACSLHIDQAHIHRTADKPSHQSTIDTLARHYGVDHVLVQDVKKLMYWRVRSDYFIAARRDMRLRNPEDAIHTARDVLEWLHAHPA